MPGNKKVNLITVVWSPLFPMLLAYKKRREILVSDLGGKPKRIIPGKTHAVTVR